MVTITKDKIATLLWNTFEAKLKATVGDLTINSKLYSIQTYASSYNDKMLDAKSNYPIVIINFPQRSEENITFKSVEADCTIEIEITANSAIVADEFFDRINDVISLSEGEFSIAGIEEIRLESTSDDMGERGGLKIHNRKCTWRFKYIYEK